MLAVNPINATTITIAINQKAVKRYFFSSILSMKPLINPPFYFARTKSGYLINSDFKVILT